jgi:serine/threonine protein kinase
MGVVYRARQLSVNNRTVAVKVIRPDRLGPDAIARFRREIIAGGMLEHPNVVRVYDAGVDQGKPYLVMEYLDGFSFAELLKTHGCLPVADACELVRQAAMGLEYAHRCGVIHRVVKLGNLFITRLGQVKVLDLGLARLTAAPDEEPLTRPGIGIGTRGYMAPEQAADAHTADARRPVRPGQRPLPPADRTSSLGRPAA